MFLLNPKEFFEFDLLDPGKLCTIISTHVPSSSLLSSLTIQSESNYKEKIEYNDNLSQQLYSSLLRKIKCFYNTCDTCFDVARVDFKLCEIFTALVIKENNAFHSDEYEAFYLPIFDLVATCKIKLGLDYYFRLCEDMNWGFYASYFIAEKAVPDFIAFALKQASKPSLSTFLLLKRCLFLFKKSLEFSDIEKLDLLSDSLDCLFKQEALEDVHFKIQINDIVNELYYHIDYIIHQLFSRTNVDNVDELIQIINTNKQIYCDITNKARNLISHCTELSHEIIDLENLHDAFILWSCLLGDLNRKYNFDFELPELSHLKIVEKYRFFTKIICINEYKKTIAMPDRNASAKYYPFLTQRLHTFMIDAFEYYFDCPLFDSLTLILEEYKKLNFEQVDHILKKDQFWSNLLKAHEHSSDKSDFFQIFSIVAKLDKHLQPDDDILNLLQQLLTFTVTILMQNHIHDIDYFEKLFKKRVDLHASKRLLNSDQFGRNLIKDVIFVKLKVDFKNRKTRKLALDIIYHAFVSPLDTYDSLLNSVLIFSPLHYNHLISYLMGNHLCSLSKCDSFVSDIVTNEQKLNLISAITIIKFRKSCDIISIESFVDYLQLLTKSTIVNFETLFANLLAYNNVVNWPLHFLQSMSELMKHIQFKTSDPNKFVMIVSILLNLLFHNWHDQTKKEIVVSTVRTYIHKNVTKLSKNQVTLIARLVEQSIDATNCPSNFSVEYLLFYIENLFSFETRELLQMNTYSILYYSSISSNSDWLVDVLMDHSNKLFDQLYHVFGEILLFLTQNELQNLITFLSKIYSKMHLFLVMSLVLLCKLNKVDKLNPDSVTYFSRSVFILLDKISTELKNHTTDNKTGHFNELLYIFFVLIAIDNKLESIRSSAQLGNEIWLEVKKIVHATESDVKHYFVKWQIASDESDYINNTYRRFREEMRQTNSELNCDLSEFSDNLKYISSNPRKTKVKSQQVNENLS